MASNITKLSRLARNKTTGNVIILIVLVSSGFILLTGFNSGVITNIDQIFILGSCLAIITGVYLINKHFRKPFFIEVSRYIEELGERRLKVQKTAVLVELVEPIQPLSVFKEVLLQLEELHSEIKTLMDDCSTELYINSAPMNTEEIQSILHAIQKFASNTLDTIEVKREKILFLIDTKRILYNSIDKIINRPRNQIESDYLVYKVMKYFKDKTIDSQLINQILNHALDQGEISGSLFQKTNGDSILAVNQIIRTSSRVQTISRTEISHCVICRHNIQSSEPRITCPHCENAFHSNHLLEWLKVFGHCPICHERISPRHIPR